MKKILIFVDQLYEDLELHYPRYRMIEEGYEVVVAGPQNKDEIKGKKGYPCKADITFDDVNVDDYAALIIPGGYAPDHLRRSEKVLEITKKFNDQNKLIAFICHAGWVPISAKILKGVKATSFKAIKEDMINAGVLWEDKAVVIDKNFISSRTPDDLPPFCKAIIKHLN